MWEMRLGRRGLALLVGGYDLILGLLGEVPRDRGVTNGFSGSLAPAPYLRFAWREEFHSRPLDLFECSGEFSLLITKDYHSPAARETACVAFTVCNVYNVYLMRFPQVVTLEHIVCLNVMMRFLFFKFGWFVYRLINEKNL
ncbi:jg18035 [Pararge aegeria aegeria]|uniref:Jg18035 protein n=1 Tax=Pararge aegeria aegeria TaxID=348720 RepID=A0A8S4QNJ6_9NEOP|nr:jg18035 [Pararge aegeria aegeria]